jgi:hypothetical protein
MEPQSPSTAPNDIVWQSASAPPSSGVPPTAGDAVPADISWAPTSGKPKKEPSDWHILKAVTRGVLGVLGEATGDKPDEIAYRNKKLGLDEPITSTGDKVAEAVGGILAPTPGGIEKGMGLAASRLADKTGLTLGQRSGSEVVQFIERSLARLPGGDFLRHAIKSQNEQLGNQSSALVDRLAAGADTSATGAGKVIKEQLKVASQRMKATAAEQYSEVEKLIPPDTKIGVKSTLATLRAFTTPTPGAENVTEKLIDPSLKAMREGLEKDTASLNMDALPYAALKELRSKLGNMIEWGPFSTDKKNGQLKKIYEALTADMNTGAAQHSDAAAAAVAKANGDYAVSKQQQKVLKSVIDKAGGPEKVFAGLISGTKEGATTLTQVVAALDGPSRQILAAGALERMGKAAPGAQTAAGNAFSAATFLTNWSKMSPEARQILFGQLPGDYAQHVTQLAGNVESLKAYEGILANPSGTGHAVLWGGEVGAAMMSLMTGNLHTAAAIAGTVAGTAAVSAALTHPATSAWLAKKTGVLVISAAKGEMGATAEDPPLDLSRMAGLPQ